MLSLPLINAMRHHNTLEILELLSNRFHKVGHSLLQNLPREAEIYDIGVNAAMRMPSMSSWLCGFGVKIMLLLFVSKQPMLKDIPEALG